MGNFQEQCDTTVLLGEHSESFMGIALELPLFCTNSYGRIGGEILSH